MTAHADERRPRVAPARPALVAALYLAVITALIYGVWNTGAGGESDLAGILSFAFLILLHLATGAAARRMWAVVLPFAAVLISIPAGYPGTSGGEPLPIWWGLLVIVAAPGAVLIAVGTVLAKLWVRRFGRGSAGAR